MSFRFLFALGALGLALVLPARTPADEVDDAFDAIERQMDGAMAAVEAQWNAMVAAEEAKWAKLQAEVEAKWDSFVAPSQKEWVEYSDDRDTRARVDYEQGQVVVEVLVPAETVKALPKEEPAPLPKVEPAPVQLPPQAVAKIEEEVKKIARPDPGRVIGPVESQVKTAKGEPVTEKNAEAFVRKEVVPKAVIEPQVVKGKDGVERRKVRVAVPMIPEHLYVRAAKFKDIVFRESEKYQMEPQLVFAVIHTESYFNPRARSPAMAFGLMQLIPNAAALESIEFLEKKRRLVDPEYLYVPENNVLLGATYLHLLSTRYYGRIEDPEKRQILMVASYNWGVGNVRSKLIKFAPPGSVTQEELLREIERRAPQETRDYVTRVTSRKQIYDGLVSGAGGTR